MSHWDAIKIRPRGTGYQPQRPEPPAPDASLRYYKYQLPPPSNPKSIAGSEKIDIGLVPDTLALCAATAFLEGALKYGPYNWRTTGVRASVYHAAMLRHLAKWWGGQNRDKKTRVHHLDSVIACLGIIRDAELYGKLVDDRPPSPDPHAMASAIDDLGELVTHLKNIAGTPT